MFTVRYANEQLKVFNSNCHTVNLIASIKQQCGYPNLDVDLAEENSGQLLYLSDWPLENASTYIKPRSSHVLIHTTSSYCCYRISHNIENPDGTATYVPLLDQTTSKQPFTGTQPLHFCVNVSK
jgi:hypothetical protein